VHIPADHPALSWRRAGLMALTGAGTGLMCPVALGAAADAALRALQDLAPGARLPQPGAALLGERARLMGLRRGGLVSANGTCRVLRARDGALAVSLSRAEDFAALPALCEDDAVTGWDSLAAALPGRSVAEVLAQARLLGLPVSPVAAPPGAGAAVPVPVGAPRARRAPRVLDLTALWAGPLAASLLGMCGALVVKLEDAARPDGARFGHAGFYALLNQGKQVVTAAFGTAAGRAVVHREIAAADIVLTSCRPRALAQLGIDPDAEAARGAVFVCITGHPDGTAAFGDDAAAAAGLNALMHAHWGAPYFAGDAIADPLTGMQAALSAWSAWLAGGGARIDLSLSGCVARHIAADRDVSPARTRAWQAMAAADTAPLYELRAVPAC